MKSKIEYVCSECGNVTSKWFGKCQACGAWNSIEEQEVTNQPAFTRNASAVKSHNTVFSKPINGWAGCWKIHAFASGVWTSW